MRYVTPKGEISYADPDHPVYATEASVDSLLAGSGNSQSNVRNSTYAAYVSDMRAFIRSSTTVWWVSLICRGMCCCMRACFITMTGCGLR